MSNRKVNFDTLIGEWMNRYNLLADDIGDTTNLTEIIQQNSQDFVTAVNYIHSLVSGETLEASNLVVAEDAFIAGGLRVSGQIDAEGGITTDFIESESITINGNEVYHTGNSGPGSGLDADTVGGIPSTNISQIGHTHVISDVASLQASLDSKSNTNHTHAASDIISGTFDDARISESSVSQHSTSLSVPYENLTGIPAQFNPAVHNHSADEITSGVLSIDRIPVLPYLSISGGDIGGNISVNGTTPSFTLFENDTAVGATIGISESVFFLQSNNIRFTDLGGGNVSSFQVRTDNQNHDIWHSGNDGGGSGLDADTLDGQEGSYYLNYNNLSNRPNISDISSTSDLSEGSNLYFTNTRARAAVNKAHVDSLNVDADTLDGLSSGSFARNNGTTNTGNFVTSGEVRGSLFRFGNSDERIDRSGNSVRTLVNNAVRTTVTSAGLSVTGTLIASGNVTANSDARLKQDIKQISGALDILSSLNGYTYYWNEVAHRRSGGLSSRRQSGVIYQDILDIWPEAASKSVNEEYGSVNYSAIIPLLIEGIKDLKTQLEELKRGNTID